MTDDLKSVPELLREIEAAAIELQADYRLRWTQLAIIRGNVTEIEVAIENGEVVLLDATASGPAPECHHMTRKRIGGDATFTTWKCLIPGCGDEWTEARD